MKATKNKTTDTPLIKLRIDYRTVITVRSKEALKMWKQRYPDAIEIV
jgi:hypothetical protein